MAWIYTRDRSTTLPALPEMQEARARVPMRWYNRALKAADKAGRDSAARLDRPDMFDLGAAAGAVAAFLAEHAPQGLPVRPDATDYEICMKARKIAADVLLRTTGLDTADALVVCLAECERQGTEPPKVTAPKESTDPEAHKAAGIVARVRCELWWRRRLRAAHIRRLEHSNIRLHYVHYRSDPYASNDAVRRRQAQNRRNAATLAATTLENENGQRFTLAELAEKSVANKALRRGELMTRLKGAEDLADAADFPGMMVSLTCPSRFHAVKQAGKNAKFRANPKYEGDAPRDAQQHLCTVWARIRAELARRGLVYFGMRVAEPHHDACPHWHMLMFHEPAWPGQAKRAAGPRIRAIIRRYALGKGEREAPTVGKVLAGIVATRRTPWRFKYQAESALLPEAVRFVREWPIKERQRQNAEPGAKRHRCDFTLIDRAKGSAVAYVAKYISKNIDGHAVGEHKTAEGYTVQADWLGDDVITPSQRVEAWAATWGIRQFQAFGGAPVGVWRELRRVKAADLPAADESQCIRDAWAAAQKTEDKPASWADYARAMGGVAGEGKRIAIRYTERMEPGRYGLTLRKVPHGVEAMGRAHIIDGIADYWRTVPIFVPATRYEWREVSRSGAAASTRTRVNNCTRPSGAASAGQKRPAWMNGLEGAETAPDGAPPRGETP
ncbi:replication endonuclease [Cupriavidus sp. CP313]